jgi:hypothetical protein
LTKYKKSLHPIVIEGVQRIMDRYSESDALEFEDFFFLHDILSWVHNETIKAQNPDV